MKNKYLVLLFLFSAFSLVAQKNPEFQDPADWIPLEKNFTYISTSVIPRPGQLAEMYSTPIAYVSEKENDFFPLNFKIRLLKFGYTEDRKERVQFWGVVDLACCKNKPVRVEMLDKSGAVIYYASTEEDGSFKAISPNGKLLEFDNYRVKVNVDRIRIIDEESNNKELIFKWLKKPSEKELKKMRKKAMREYKNKIRYLEELRSKNDY